MDIGLIRTGDPSAEWEAALAWSEQAVGTVDVLEATSLTDSAASLNGYDAVWWHSEQPLADPRTVRSLRSPVRSFLDEGGGLLLTLRALSAVGALGIDPVAPDATGLETDTRRHGLCWTARHDDHAVSGGLSRRVTTAVTGAADGYAGYESVLPERGELLASARRDGTDRYDEMTAFGWSEPGPVLGFGSGLYFHSDDRRARERERVMKNALQLLGADGDFGVGRPLTAQRLGARREWTDAHARNRPRYHVTPPGNWLNDPNGMVHYDGRYHLFYQYNPAGAFHGTIHWGHAVSDDLVHWEDRPVALTPEHDGPDRDGCWSGCAVVDDGTPTVVYTGVRGGWQLPCLATGDDPGLTRWEQEAGNPVVGAPPAELDVPGDDEWTAHFRDHCVWQDGGTWHQLIGTGVADVGGAVAHYSSPDLRSWSYEGPILVADRPDAGPVWECPELLELGDRDLLHVSNYEDVRYFLGSFTDGTFDVERQGLLDYGDLYAPQSLTTPDGRSVTVGWLREARSARAQWDAGWSGAMSLPRVLSVGEDGRLRQRPARELAALRTDRVVDIDEQMSTDERTLDLSGDAVELSLTVEVDDGATFELQVRADGSGERTPVRYDGEAVVVDRSAASHDETAETSSQRLPVDGGPLSLRVFVDGSVLELFANERRCLSSRIYPTSPAESYRVGVRGGGAALRLEGWRLGSAWTGQS